MRCFLLLAFSAALSAAERPIIADYAALLQESKPRADGLRHVDTPASIAALKALHANMHFYLMRNQMDWDDMSKEFLPAAAEAGIDVFPYLVPPTECPDPCKLPFGADYPQIAIEIAKLSLRYPNLKGLAIDDFVYNVKLYTPEYVAHLRNAAREINPKFKFYPLLYWRSMQPAFLDKYAASIDGVIFAYRDEPTINTTRNGSLRAQLDATEAMMRERSKDLVLMIYAAPLGHIPLPPGADYVRDCLAMGLADARGGKLAGVVTYSLSKTRQPSPPAGNYARNGVGRLSILASGSGIPAGSYGELSSRISVTAGAPVLKFWKTGVCRNLPAGNYFMQVLIDDAVAWEQDVSTLEQKVWKQERVELPAALFAGKSTATLRLRLALKRNYGNVVLIGMDDLEVEGFTIADPGFEDQAAWTATQTAPAFLPLVQLFEANRLPRMFDAVSEVYRQ